MKKYRVIKRLTLYVPEEVTLEVGSIITAEALFVLHFEDFSGLDSTNNLHEYLEEVKEDV